MSHAVSGREPTNGSDEKIADYSKRVLAYGFFPGLQQVRAFASVAELGRISQAAIELNLSQSAIAQAIATLESDLGALLFERRNKGSYLTKIGNILKQRTGLFFERMREALGEFVNTNASIADIELNMLCRRITKAQILALIAIKESGSFIQAARHAGVSQPAIHRSARTLEENLGSKIFHVTAQGATTNERGSLLADRLHLAIREFEWAYEEVQAEKGLVRGRILVGGLLLAGSPFLATALSKFTAAYPDANIDITNGSYDALLYMLRTGSIDFIVGLLKNPPPSDDVVEAFLATDPYVIAVRKGHPLANKANVSREQLAQYDWVLPGPTAARRASFEKLFEDLPSPPRANIKTHSFTIILMLLAESDSMTILTESQLFLDRRFGHNLTALKFNLPEPSASIGVTMRKKWLPTHLQENFLQSLKLAAEHPASAQ